MAQDPSTNTAPAGAHFSHTPQDARLISLIIASMGIKDMEPGVEMMLLEWAHRYIHTILSDSLVYSAHAHPSTSSNPQITQQDLILAIQSHLSHSLIQQPSKSALLSLASSMNSMPLPPISDRYGLRLPPKEHCLTNVNFSIVPDELDDEEEEEEGHGAAMQTQEQSQSQSQPQVVDEDDAADAADVSMQDGDAAAPAATAAADSRGTKRSLEEDDDYD